MGSMKYKSYREMTENDELKRRVSRLEEKMNKLQSDNKEMRKLLKSGFGVLKLKVLEDNNELQQLREQSLPRFVSPGVYTRETDHSGMPLKKSNRVGRKKSYSSKVLRQLMSEQDKGLVWE